MESPSLTNPHERRLKALQRIAVELMNTQSSRQVLSLIVEQAVDLLHCDAGSLFLRHDERDLVFEVAINRSIQFDFEKSQIPVLGQRFRVGGVGLILHRQRSAAHDVSLSDGESGFGKAEDALVSG